MAGNLWGGSMKDWLMGMEKWLWCCWKLCGKGVLGSFHPKKLDEGKKKKRGRKLLLCGVTLGNGFLAKIPKKTWGMMGMIQG